MSGLTIYKASAGSGKTFAITREYIYLLFRDIENYKHILGVTFTNKATAEMKNRIIAELDNLSKGNPSDYANGLKEKYQLQDAELKHKASFILSKILHDYSHFTILTIDSFFQRIIRAFAREIGFYQGFDIEMDQERILTTAVDQMIFELDTNPSLRDWLVRFAEDKVLEGNSWNFNRDIENIGREVFKETFKEIGDNQIAKITDKKLLDTFGKKLDIIKSEFELEIRQKGKDAVNMISKSGLRSDDFKGKSYSVSAFFEKLIQTDKFEKFELKDSIRNHYNDIDKWKGKDKTKNIAIDKAFDEGLNQILGEIITIYDSRFQMYKSVSEVQKHLYVLGVVADLMLHIRDYTSGRNLFMISDTSQFLNKLIQGSDAPFIYERTGTLIRHFMIDEFQDTSTLQWSNFKPLIINSLAEGNENWVVGDVKQSIYRWRNSDWTILSEKIFDDILPHRIDVETLQYNWRSSKNIISFNNSFFRNAIQSLLTSVISSQRDKSVAGLDDFEHLLTNAYSDFAQLVPASKNTDIGYVNIEFIPKNSNSELKFEDQALERLPALIENLLDHQYHLKDIAILVRTRNEGNLVSDYLLKYQKQHIDNPYHYDIISNDSLLLKNSETVKWLIAAFTCIAAPDDQLNMAFLWYEFESYLNFSKISTPNPDESSFSGFQSDNSGQKDENIHNLFSNSRMKTGKPNEFFNQGNLKQYPVYELCDKIINHFGLTEIKSELPYLLAFQDMLQDYGRKEQSDLHSFLRWWEENQDKRVINMPDNQDAIRLMTLHTAKGLEFKVVILPFGEWTFMKSGWNGNILWCKTSTEPFTDLELLPVNLSKSLQETVFSQDYFREKALSYVDNLNLLYVAFTRAIDALYVMVPQNSKNSVDNHISDLISEAIKQQSFEPATVDYPAIRLIDFWNEEESRFVYGDLPISQEKHTTSTSISLEDLDYTNRSISDVVKQVIPASDYFSTEREMLGSRINSGKIMHEVFQQIKTVEDIDSALLSMLIKGKIQEQDVKKLAFEMKENLKLDQVQPWFTNQWEIRTEAGILLKDGSLPRPDRVLVKNNKALVIDYKFGDTEHPSHQVQVRKYMQYLVQMGYSDVKGYLWYVSLKKVIPLLTNPEQGKLF